MPITKQEMVQIMEEYIRPFYEMIGAATALIVLLLAFWLILWPFLKKRRIR